MTKLAKQIAIQENLFMHNNTLYERLYDHTHKYRFFFDDDYDYVDSLAK